MGNLPKFTLHEARVLLKLEHIGPPGFLTEDEHEAWNALLDGCAFYTCAGEVYGYCGPGSG